MAWRKNGGSRLGGIRTLVEKVSKDEYFALKTLEQEGLTNEKLKRFLQEQICYKIDSRLLVI